jgi:hypothetical protein
MKLNAALLESNIAQAYQHTDTKECVAVSQNKMAARYALNSECKLQQQSLPVLENKPKNPEPTRFTPLSRLPQLMTSYHTTTIIFVQSLVVSWAQ